MLRDCALNVVGRGELLLKGKELRYREGCIYTILLGPCGNDQRGKVKGNPWGCPRHASRTSESEDRTEVKE